MSWLIFYRNQAATLLDAKRLSKSSLTREQCPRSNISSVLTGALAERFSPFLAPEAFPEWHNLLLRALAWQVFEWCFIRSGAVTEVVKFRPPAWLFAWRASQGRGADERDTENKGVPIKPSWRQTVSLSMDWSSGLLSFFFLGRSLRSKWLFIFSANSKNSSLICGI